MIPIALGGHDCADDRRSSTPTATRRWRWQLLVAAPTLLGCTVTGDGFEPALVTTAPELEPVMAMGSEPSPPPSAPARDHESPVSTSTEQPSGELPLAPAEPEPPSSSNSESSASDAADDEPPAGEGPPVEPAPEAPAPDEPRAGEPPTDEPVVDEPGVNEPGAEQPPESEAEPPDDSAAPDAEGDVPDAPEAPTPPEPAPVEPPSNPCPGLQFGSSCYEIFTGPATWDAAEQQCVAWGGHLASIGSAEEDAFLDAWPARLGISGVDGSNLWLGATDAVLEGDFRWSDGTPFQFSGFAVGQPDNGLGRNCIVKRNDGTQRWYDLGCTDQSRFACERGL